MIVYSVYPFDARVRREAETLAASGSIEVTVLCLREHDEAQSYATKEKVNVKELKMGKYGGNRTLGYVISYLRFLIKAFFACSGLFLRGALDIVHVHNMPNALIFTAIIPKLFGKKVILDMHDSEPDTFAAKFGNSSGLLYKIIILEEKLSAWMSDKVICVNHVQKEVAISRGIPSKKIYISMNVPDHKRFKKPSNPVSNSNTEGQFKLVYHGTMAERLGIDLAIEAVDKLKKQIPGVELHLWGGGKYTDFLRDKCLKPGYNETVHFHNWVPVEKLSVALAKMDVGVIPNRKSAATELMLPVKLMEYIALGIPVVAPKLKAIQYYFTDEMVSFFEPENIDEMAEAVMKIYQDASRRKSQKEKAEEFLKRYGWEKQSVDFIDFYLKV